MHLELARISRNPFLNGYLEPLHLNFNPYVSQIEKFKNAHLASLVDWQDVVEAIEKGK